MEEMTTMEAKLNDFILSLPGFMDGLKSKIEKRPKAKLRFGKRMIVYQGELTPPNMELWCKLMAKHGIPFSDGQICDYHNDMYLGWKTRFTMIYLSAHYVPYKDRTPLELSWCMLTIDTEVKDGEHDEI